MKVESTSEITESNYGGPNSLRKICIRDNNGYTRDIYFYRYFTGNCQLGSIAYANNFLCEVSSDKDIKALFNSLRKELGSAYPNQFLFDVNQNLAPLVRDYFDCVVDAPYTSTNGTLMNIFVVKSPQ